jgi:hypothetical protein
MHATAIRLALLGAAAAFLAGCASPEPVNVTWERQSMIDQHRFMPGLLRSAETPLVVVNTGRDGAAIAMGDAPRPAAQAVAQGDRVLLVTQEEYARLQGSNPQVLGAPPAQPAAPATR